MTRQDKSMGEPKPSLGCNYAGYEFGASYPDSMCIDGYLWDADSCDEPGGGLTSGGDIPCPCCNTAEFLAAALEEAKAGGCGRAMFTPWCAAVVWEAALVKAERENAGEAARFLATLEPFVTADWPDREAVYQGRARWDHTIDVTFIAGRAALGHPQ